MAKPEPLRRSSVAAAPSQPEQRVLYAVPFVELPLSGDRWCVSPRATQLLTKHRVNPAELARVVREVCTAWPDPNGRLPIIPWVQGDKVLPLIARLAGRVKGHFQILLEERDECAVTRALCLRFGLTAREAEVLGWIAQGKTSAVIAAILGCKTRTVDKHTERVLAKLGVETRTAAAAVLHASMT